MFSLSPIFFCYAALDAFFAVSSAVFIFFSVVYYAATPCRRRFFEIFHAAMPRFAMMMRCRAMLLI